MSQMNNLELETKNEEKIFVAIDLPANEIENVKARRNYVFVDYEDRKLAPSAGGVYDPILKSWFTYEERNTFLRNMFEIKTDIYNRKLKQIRKY